MKTGLKHYYGDLHTHTGFSDGRGTPKEAFEWAKASKMGDFLAVSDHEGSITMQKWMETLKAADEVTDETFVGIASYESGYSEEFRDEDGVAVVNGGELNLFGTDALLVEAGYPTDFKDFYEKLRKHKGAIAFYNHPQEASWPTDKIWNAYDEFGVYEDGIDDYIVGMETSNETSAYNHIHELVYTIALDKGWKFAPYATTDTHSGNWLSGFENRTVVLAESLTRAHIIEAFRKRHVYAVQDKNFQVEFAVNGRIMGSILSPKDHTYHIEVEVLHKEPHEGGAFKRLEIISDYGQVVASCERKDFHMKWNVTLESETARYFFLRVVNEEGKKAWSAPVWTGRKPDEKVEAVKGRRIRPEAMKVIYASSEKDSCKACEILNPDTKTYWESEETSGEIIIDLGEEKELIGIGYRKNYIAYEDKEALAKLMDGYCYEVSKEEQEGYEVVASGRVRNYGSEHYRSFEAIKARYVKIKALNAIEEGIVAIGNIYIYEM
ncbi:MAG: CehA/McbA family metallohydrolase [Zhenhengia sp.]|uniref:CehA/McbA family metallohydrolase n=1 Tax=Zhenhengia sp. TaxID=2944208 RepID=UPI0039961F44